MATTQVFSGLKLIYLHHMSFESGCKSDVSDGVHLWLLLCRIQLLFVDDSELCHMQILLKSS